MKQTLPVASALTLFGDTDTTMMIIDAHQDIAYNALSWGRDYTRHPLEARERDASLGYWQTTNGLPDAILGRVGVVFASIFTVPASKGQTSRVPGESVLYGDTAEAYRAGMRQMDYYQRLADTHRKVRLVRSAGDLAAVIAGYAPDTTLENRVQGLVISFEGADPITEPKQFEEWYERGVRVVGLSWGATRYGGGTGAPSGLTPLGYELLSVLSEYRVIVDLAHSSEKMFYEVLDAYPHNIIASHANPRKFCDTDRHLSDTMIRRLAERDGVMGVVLLNAFLSSRWSSGDAKAKVPLTVVADVIDYVCQLTGSAQHIGIGSDIDGGFGAQSIPDGIDTVGDLGNIAVVLQARGYSPQDILAIMGGNFLRQLGGCLV